MLLPKGNIVTAPRTGLIIDINSLYYATRQKYGQKRLQLIDYTKALEDQGHLLTFKVAYSRQDPKSCKRLISLLRGVGFETHFGELPWSIAMALRAAEIVPLVDVFVLGSSDEQSGRMLEYAKRQGKLTKCFSIDIPPFFSQFAHCVEVEESLLVSTDQSKPLELSPNVLGNGGQPTTV